LKALTGRRTLEDVDASDDRMNLLKRRTEELRRQLDELDAEIGATGGHAARETEVDLERLRERLDAVAADAAGGGDGGSVREQAARELPELRARVERGVSRLREIAAG
jgi:hypothetical protein